MHSSTFKNKLGKLRVAANHRYLEYDDGTPFFYLGDTAWELFHRLKPHMLLLDINMPVKTGDEALEETRAQSLLDSRDVGRAGIRGEDHLAASGLQRVEGVEELLLGSFLAGDELNVIHQQEVYIEVKTAARLIQ